MTAGHWRYNYAGFCLVCAFELPPLGPPLACAKTAPDVVVGAVSGPLQNPVDEWLHHWRSAEDETELSLGRLGNRLVLRFPDQADFVVSAVGVVDVHAGSGTGCHAIQHLLLDQVVPRVLAHRGALVLHGSAVATQSGRAIVAIGPSGYGKSTLAAALAQSAKGILLADDCVVLHARDGQMWVQPSYPGLRLWSDSFEHAMAHDRLPERAVAGGVVSESSDKVRVLAPVRPEAPSVSGWPVAAVLVLGDNDDAREPESAGKDQFCTLEALPAGRACMAMLANCFQLEVAHPRVVRQLLAQAAVVAERTHVLEINYPHDYSVLADVTDKVLEHIEGIAGHATGADPE